MTDIVERLRNGSLTKSERRAVELEAADEIERLRVENEKLHQMIGHHWAELKQEYEDVQAKGLASVRGEDEGN